jgi:hypothetical protein
MSTAFSSGFGTGFAAISGVREERARLAQQRELAEKGLYQDQQRLDADAAQRRVELANHLQSSLDRYDAARPELLTQLNTASEQLSKANLILGGPAPGPTAQADVERLTGLYQAIATAAQQNQAKSDAASRALMHISILGTGGGGGASGDGGGEEGGQARTEQAPQSMLTSADYQQAQDGGSRASGAEQPPANFDTALSPQEETAFAAWKQKNAPNDSGQDYDLRGAFKAGLTPDPQTGHWPDTFKKPNHPTFSDQSQYAKFAPAQAGHWNGENYEPGAARQSLAQRWLPHLANAGFPPGQEVDGNYVIAVYDKDTADALRDRLKGLENRFGAKSPVVISDKSEELKDATGVMLSFWDKMDRAAAAQGRFEVMKATPKDTAKILAFAAYAKQTGNAEEAQMWEAIGAAPEADRLKLIEGAVQRFDAQRTDAAKYRDLFKPAVESYAKNVVGVNGREPAAAGGSAKAPPDKAKFYTDMVAAKGWKAPFTPEQKAELMAAWHVASGQ